MLVRSELRKGIRIFDKESCEQFLWWKLDKNFFHMKQGLFICSVYISPQNFSKERRLDCDHFESLQQSIYKFSKLGSIILCGDFNVRMGNLDGCGNNTSFLEDFFQSTSLLMIQLNCATQKTNHRNSYGKLYMLSELCCANNLIVLNGRMKGDYILVKPIMELVWLITLLFLQKS